jgi:hypothetical protein
MVYVTSTGEEIIKRIAAGDPAEYLELVEFNELCTWLTANGFDDSSLSMSDTRQALTEKLITISNE